VEGQVDKLMVVVEVLEDIELLFQGELKLTLKMEHLIQ
jgi:hypothetical protein